jgi:hypothetical protein
MMASDGRKGTANGRNSAEVLSIVKSAVEELGDATGETPIMAAASATDSPSARSAAAAWRDVVTARA